MPQAHATRVPARSKCYIVADAVEHAALAMPAAEVPVSEDCCQVMFQYALFTCRGGTCPHPVVLLTRVLWTTLLQECSYSFMMSLGRERSPLKLALHFEHSRKILIQGGIEEILDVAIGTRRSVCQTLGQSMSLMLNISSRYTLVDKANPFSLDRTHFIC